MECVRARTVVPFITHRRESQGYQKETTDSTDYFGNPYKLVISIKDNLRLTMYGINI